MKYERLLFSIGLMAVLLNIVFSIYDENVFAFLGWLTALFWFPYKRLVQKNG